MQIPAITFELCFLFDWCYHCAKVTELKQIPHQDHPNILTKYCPKCETIYNLRVQETFKEDAKMPVPDFFILPSMDIINSFIKKFN